jgi:hypothetical protein
VSQQINLYNPLFLKQEKHFSAYTMAQALGAIGLGLAALYVYALMETRTAERSAQQVREHANAQREQFVKLTASLSPQARSKALEADVARLEAEVKSRQSTLELLNTGELGNTSGFSDFLAAFGRQALPGVWLTGISIGESGNELVVSGRALRPELLPAYLRALNNEPMMRGRLVTQMKLAAKSVPPPAPGAAAKARPNQPERFVEFVLAAPLHATEAPTAGSAPKGPGQ